MKNSSALIIGFGVIASLLIVSACDPTAQEMAVRMRMQQLINMFPSIYDDIRAGRLVPNRPGYQQNGQYVNPTNGQMVMPNGQQMIMPNGQQMVMPNGQQMVMPNGQQMVMPNGQQMVMPNGGQMVVPQQTG